MIPQNRLQVNRSAEIYQILLFVYVCNSGGREDGCKVPDIVKKWGK